MGIQEWSGDIVLVELTPEPMVEDELEKVIKIISERKGDADVVMDFSSVDVIQSKSLFKLLKLRVALSNCGHRLVLCNVAPATKGIFVVTGIDGKFECADDVFTALASLQMVS